MNIADLTETQGWILALSVAVIAGLAVLRALGR